MTADPSKPGATLLLAIAAAGTRKRLTDFLADDGYTLLTSGDGLEVLSLLQERSIDLAILDLDLPRKDGPGHGPCPRSALQEGKSMGIRHARSLVMPAIAVERKREGVECAGAGQRVTWIDGATPGGEESRVAFEAISQRGLGTFEEVAEYLAKTFYWRDVLRGGWATDIGLLRPLYRREAREALERLNGRCIRIT